MVFVLAIQAPAAFSQLLLSGVFSRISQSLNLASQQAPLEKIPVIIMPPTADDTEPSAGTDGVIISDVISRDRVINIFAGFTRDIDNISKRLGDNAQNTTVLAPLNSEIQKLPRKPWEDPKDYEELGANAYGGSDGEDRAHKNLRRFVEAHVVPVSPWKEGDKVEAVGGGKLWWENKDGRRTVCVAKALHHKVAVAHGPCRYNPATSRYRVLLVRFRMVKCGLLRGLSITNRPEAEAFCVTSVDCSEISNALKLRHLVYYEYEFMIGIEDILQSYSTFAGWRRNLRLLILAIAALHTIYLLLVLYSLLVRKQPRLCDC